MLGRRTVVAAVLAALTGAACDRSPAPLRSCEDPLGGVWTTEPGAATSATWHLIDSSDRLDGFPSYRELPPEPAGTIAAPSLVSLRRRHGEVAGTVSRRWQRGAATCVVRSPAVVRGCVADRIGLQLGPTGAPVDWTTCAPTGEPVMQLLRRSWP